MTLLTVGNFEDFQRQGLAEAIYMFGKDIWQLKPRTAQQLAEMLNWAEQQGKKLALSVKDAVLMSEPIWLDYTSVKQVRKHAIDDFVIQVEAGITYGALAALLSECNQTLPLSYSPELTLGEILAYDLPSLETGLLGYPRDFVLKTEIATPDGQLTVSGADVVKSVTGYDLHKLYVGARHAFGVITAVTLKLTALPTSSRHWVYSLESLDAALQLADKLIINRLPIHVCEIYQEAQDWRVLVEAAGEPSMMLDCETNLLGLTRPLTPRTISEKAAQSLMQQLQIWPPEQMIVEIAFPSGQCRVLVNTLFKQPWLKEYGVKLQIRRAAGLCYLIVPFLPIEVLDELIALTQQFEGFMQMMQLPPKHWGDASLMNLPTNPTVRGLLKTLKSGYDPKGVLFTPNMPL